MAGRLEGKVAIVTGGASGMGKATVFRFAAEGAAVAAVDLNEVNGKALEAEVADAGLAGRIRFVRADVAAEDDVAAAVSFAVSEFGGLDIMFNNAGVGGAFGRITDIHVDDWDYTFAVLCRGVFLGIKHAARAMKTRGHGGSIINTASVAGLSGGAGPQAYSAAKAAVVNLTRSAAVELAADRIRVNAICPGGILTPLVLRNQDEAAVAARMDTLQPWPSHGRGEDIAGAALFLASDDSTFVTGEALVVDGGLTAAGPSLFRQMREAGPLSSFTGVNRGNTGEAPVVRQD